MISSMPIYDYRCDHCGHAFSVVLSFAAKAVEVCPACGKRPRKLMVAPAVLFKGSGWYKTDSRIAPKGDGDASGTKAGGKADAKAEGKTDAKTETKPASDAAPATAPAKAPAKAEAAS